LTQTKRINRNLFAQENYFCEFHIFGRAQASGKVASEC